MNIEINLFTVIEKDLKNVLERSCPLSDLWGLRIMTTLWVYDIMTIGLISIGLSM